MQWTGPQRWERRKERSTIRKWRSVLRGDTIVLAVLPFLRLYGQRAEFVASRALLPRGRPAISYRTTGFPRLFFLFFELPLAAHPFPAFSLSLSIFLFRIFACNTSVHSCTRILQIIFITGLTAVSFLERISFFLCFVSSPDYFLDLNSWIWNVGVISRSKGGWMLGPRRLDLENSCFDSNRDRSNFETFAISFHVWIKPK